MLGFACMVACHPSKSIEDMNDLDINRATQATPDVSFSTDQDMDVTSGVFLEAGTRSLAYERFDGLPPAPESFPQFRFPIADQSLNLISTQFIIGVDHQSAQGQSTIDCQSYNGRSFPACYDDHEGSDFILEGGFDTMDAGSAMIVAAASGEVVDLHDGEYDRCHADLLSMDVSCDGYPMLTNYITLRHEGGWLSSYLHLKKNSIIVRRGDQVHCGQALALIGSSGYSSAPHLHFEIEDDLGRIWDPFAGEFSQPYSLWIDEGTDVLPLAICLP